MILYLSSYSSYLASRNNMLIVKKRVEDKFETFPVSPHELRGIIIEKAASLTYKALQLAAPKVPIVIKDYNKILGFIYSEIPSGNTKHIQAFVSTRPDKALKIAKFIVKSKLRNQANNLRYLAYKGTYVEDKDYLISSANEIRKLENLIPEIKDTSSLLALEGKAADIYWLAVAEYLSWHDISFEGRGTNRREGTVNAYLNYAYGITSSFIAVALLIASLDLQLSFLHKPYRKRYSTVYDLLEIYRPSIDRKVIAWLCTIKNIKGKIPPLEEQKWNFADQVLTLLGSPNDPGAKSYHIFKDAEKLRKICNIVAETSEGLDFEKPLFFINAT